jgi:phosphatidate cytidylyltransferase
VRAAPDLDDLDLPPTAAVPVVPEVEPEPAPPPRPAPAPKEDLDDIRVWAAPADDEDDVIEAGRSAPDNPFADLMGDDDDLDLPGPAEDDLPHWSEPAATEGDDDAWAGVSAGPRWRGQGEESGEPEDFSDLIDETYVESPGEDEMIFDDMNAPAVDAVESPAGPPQRRNPYPDAPDDDDQGGGGGSGRDMQQAVVVGAGLVVALLVCGFLGEWALCALALGVIVVATAEFFTATRRAGYHPAPLVGLVGSGGLVLGAYWRGEVGIPLILFVLIVLAMCWWLFDAGPSDHAVANMGITVLGVMYVGFLGSFAALLLRQPNGSGLLFGAILVTVAADIGGLFVGQRMGRSPLTAASPNKTVEGFVGGIVAAVVVSCLVLGVGGWFPWEFMDALILGVVGGIMAPLGDLCESRLKRDLGLKDMGTILPGHGGVLDRFDGMLFVLPATYAVVLLLEVYANTP